MSDPLTEAIIGAAMKSTAIWGRGCGVIYEEGALHRDGTARHPFQRQVEVDVRYKGRIIKGQQLDLLVQEKWSSIAQTPRVATRSYLKAMLRFS